MTVENTDNKKRGNGNGVTTAIPFSFRVLEAADLKVYLIDKLDPDLTPVLQTEGVDYDLTLEDDGEGGEVDFNVAPTSDEEYFLYNDPDLTQPADLPTEGNFNEESVETALDRACLINIKQKEQIARGLSLQVTDPLNTNAFAGFFIKIATPLARVDRLLKFNATGDGVEEGPTTQNVDILAEIAAAIQIVADNIGAVNTVADDIDDDDDLNTVAENIADVQAVGQSIADVNIVADDLGGTDTIGTVATNIANVNTVGNNIASVNTAAGSIANINTVAGSIANVNTVAGSIANVNAVAGNAANINAVAGNAANINTVAGMAASIATVVANITDIQNAEENAAIALAAATRLNGTSATSVAIGLGSKGFVTQAGKFFNVGNWLLIASAANPANYMHGQVTAYDATDGNPLTVDVTNIGGAGTFTDWVITLSGTRGATGAAGAPDFSVLAAETTIALNDEVIINDISVPEVNKMTVENLLKAINLLTTDGSPDGAADYVMTYDASASTVKKVLLALLGPPSGTIYAYAGSSAPAGHLLAYGQAVSRTTYANLFTAISTTFGVGDGSTTFNVPDLRGRTIAGVDNMGGSAANRITSGGSGITGTTLGNAGGAETHTLTTAQLSVHTPTGTFAGNALGTHLHTALGSNLGNTTVGSSNLASSGSQNTSAVSAGTPSGTITMNSIGSGSAHNNTQPTMMLNYIIKT